MVLVEQMLHRREILTADGESLQVELFMIRKVSVPRTKCFRIDASLRLMSLKYDKYVKVDGKLPHHDISVDKVCHGRAALAG